MMVDAELEGGNIVVLGYPGPGEAELALRTDTNAPFLQWFHFRARDVPSEGCRLRVVNAGEATFADGFRDYWAFASYDLLRWFRVPTAFEGGVLGIDHVPGRPEVFYAYFAPYPAVRRAQIVGAALRSPRARVRPVGAGLQGRDVNVIAVGADDAERKVWVVARQHSGEPMAEWFVEGLVGRLLDEHDAAARALLERTAFYVVPNLNPDGTALGNQRVNAAGTDLNRAWDDPSEEASPEVFAVRRAMEKTGVDLFLDVHGDERIPYAFAAGCEGNPGYSDRLAALENLFLESLAGRSPDFRQEYGYEPDAPGEGDRKTAGNFVGEAFDCLSFTLEMPFKETAERPAREAWSPRRSIDLGRVVLETVLEVSDSLR